MNVTTSRYFQHVLIVCLVWIVAACSVHSAPILSLVEMGPREITGEMGGGYVGAAVGRTHALAVKANGHVVGWGDDRWAQSTAPLVFSGVKKAVVGDGFSALLIQDIGSIKIFGRQGYNVIVPPPNNYGFVDIAAGSGHIVALRGSGEVLAWGDNYHGQCIAPEGTGPFRNVTAGDAHSAALHQDGSVVCWGDNSRNQCHVPTPNADFIAISAGAAHTAGLKSDGSVVCWGDNTYGQCDPPQNNAGFVAVSAGYWCTAALRADGSVVCWGRDAMSINLAAFAAGPYRSISAGDGIMAGIRRDGALVCWGSGQSGVEPLPRVTESPRDVAPGLNHTAMVCADGRVQCWGRNAEGQCQAPASTTGVQAVAAGAAHTVALRADGRVICWGDNTYRQLNAPTNVSLKAISAAGHYTLGLTQDGRLVFWGTAPHGQDQLPEPNGPFVQVVAGLTHAAAIRDNGTVVCWGSNVAGQCDAPDNVTFRSVAIGFDHTAGLTQDGRVLYWGGGYQVMPWNPGFLSPIVAVSAGSGQTMAVDDQGRIYRMGQNRYWNNDAPTTRGYISLYSGNGRVMAVRTLQAIEGIAFSDDQPMREGTALSIEMRIPTSAYSYYVSAADCAMADSQGRYLFITPLLPGHDAAFRSGRHLQITVPSTSLHQPLDLRFINGDVDGDNSITLFDYLALDAVFGMVDADADLDGDGQVTLFDYLIVDRNFGAVGG